MYKRLLFSSEEFQIGMGIDWGCLVAAAVLYLYPARHTQAAPVFRDKPI